MAKKPIQIWEFHDAPEKLKSLSTNGGDEDWLALIPKGYDVPHFLEHNRSFGVCDTDRHDLQDGSVVLIGVH